MNKRNKYFCAILFIRKFLINKLMNKTLEVQAACRAVFFSCDKHALCNCGWYSMIPSQTKTNADVPQQLHTFFEMKHLAWMKRCVSSLALHGRMSI